MKLENRRNCLILPEKFYEKRGSQIITVHKCSEENTQKRKNKGTRHAFHLGVLLGHTDYMQMCAPAKVMSQPLG
eukprot:1147580-Pelagomonas_calceolata.AAC.1